MSFVTFLHFLSSGAMKHMNAGVLYDADADTDYKERLTSLAPKRGRQNSHPQLTSSENSRMCKERGASSGYVYKFNYFCSWHFNP